MNNEFKLRLYKKTGPEKVIWIRNYSMIPQKSCGQRTSFCYVNLIILLILTELSTQLSGYGQERKTGQDIVKLISQNSSLEENVRLTL